MVEDDPQQAKACCDPSAGVAHDLRRVAARCKTLLWSRFVEPGGGSHHHQTANTQTATRWVAVCVLVCEMARIPHLSNCFIRTYIKSCQYIPPFIPPTILTNPQSALTNSFTTLPIVSLLIGQIVSIVRLVFVQNSLPCIKRSIFVRHHTLRTS